ncbi:MAG: putative glycosyltransferase [uncultured marine phage]|uniref:Putative glycosyltransferase n=1 Tax=uncultured marine phage TaxID=707152 RepID=A0A8D9CCP6_9VIRU|nr:MAG: putative glycosyltransferase [uncultured marine phage]
MKNFTYIIPFNSSIDDLSNLRKVIKWVNGWNNIQLIVVEHDTNSSKLDIISEPFKLIYIKPKYGVFNKAWAYNAALRVSDSDIVICGDSNTVTNPENLKKGIELLKEYDVVKPYSKTIDIVPSQLNDFKLMDKEIDAPVLGETGERPIYLCTGITIFKKDALQKMGGWEEKFEMDCFEEFQTYKVKKLSKWFKLDGKAYSMPSGKPHNDNTVTKDVNTNNQLKVLSDQHFNNYIMSTYNKLGEKNRYE